MANGCFWPTTPGGERLIPLHFFVTGGSYDFDNLSVKDAAVAMQIRGPIAQKIHNAPEGATIDSAPSETAFPPRGVLGFRRNTRQPDPARSLLGAPDIPAVHPSHGDAWPEKLRSAG
ncbi:hypothetical protein AB0B07_14705 [Streptomyces sioyaensis]|uniref:hypothetical protein n=1 Tax=Streptomyces sioyaensis TaxID=67364 RepID=UPI0033F89E01